MSELVEICDEVTTEEIEGVEVQARRQEPRRREKKREDEAPSLPDPSELAAASCLSDTANLAAAEAEVSEADAKEVEELNQRLGDVRSKFASADRLEVTSRTKRCKAAALLLPDLRRLLEQPGLIFALAQILEIRLTGATLKSPSLAAMRVLLPKMARRQRSFWAQVFNVALSCGWTAQQFEKALTEYGAVELRRWETRRQRLRAGQGEKPGPKEVIEGYCARQTPLPISEASLPESEEEAGLVLMLARRVGDELVFYGVVDDERQVLAAVKLCEKRNRQVVAGPQEPEELLAAE